MTFDVQRLVGASTQQIVDMGVIDVPEGRRLFPAMTVRDQLLLGAFRRNDRATVKSDIDRVLGLFPRLREWINALGRTLSGGEQQMAEIIAQINRDGTTILIVEQDVQTALDLASRAYVLETVRCPCTARPRRSWTTSGCGGRTSGSDEPIP